MYASANVMHDGNYGYQATMFNPYAAPYNVGSGRGSSAAAGVGAYGSAYDAYGPQVTSIGMMPQMNAALLAEQQAQQVYGPARAYHSGNAAYGSHSSGLPIGGGTDAHHTSFGSSNTSFSGPSTPATAGVPTSNTKSSRRHNPYASTASNASNSEPSSPAMAPAIVASRVPPADASFFSSMSSANGSTTHSPVYAPVDLAAYGADAASHHPIAFSINEQFAQARGSLASTACTPRGRHLLVGALRQQHTDKIAAIFDELAPHIASIIIDPNGGHVVRTLVEFLDEAQIATLVEYLTPEVVLTIATSSQNTRRVLQTLFERHRSVALQPVIDVIATHAIALATTQQGCIAVMRCLEHALEPQRMQVLQALTPQLAALTMDPYGNYVVQAVLQYFTRETACEVLEKAFAGHWINLSCNKFASNVMEKFIQAAPPVTRKTILDELVYESEVLGAIMHDGFGNFVLQQIIDTCTTGPEYRKLTEKIRPLLGSSPFGHKIEAKLKSKRFGPPYVVNQENPGHPGGSKPTRQGKGKDGHAKPSSSSSAQQQHLTSVEVASSSTQMSSASSHRSQSNSSNAGM